MEFKLSQESIQKSQVIQFIEQISSSLPADSLRECFTAIFETITQGFHLEQEYIDRENQLVDMENELRSYAKREAEGLLSTKVMKLRKNVE